MCSMRSRLSTMPRRYASSFAFALAGTVVLTLGFARNHWKVAEENWFVGFQRDTEAAEIGRIARSRHEGLFSDGALTGWGDAQILEDWVTPEDVDLQYRAFVDQRRFRSFLVYQSRPGLEALAYGLLDRALSPLPTATRLDVLHWTAAFLSALACSAIATWTLSQFGWLAAVLTLLSAVLSPWLTAFGRNLWWNLWAFYLPLFACTAGLAVSSPRRHVRKATLFAAVFLAALIKCFFNGYEYSTTTLMMAIVPCAYYALRDSWGARLYVTSTAVAAAACMLAVLLSLVVLCAQIAMVRGSAEVGIEHIVSSLGKRSYGSPEAHAAKFGQSLQAGAWTVLRPYWIAKPVLALPPALQARTPATGEPASTVTSLNLTEAFACASLFAVLLHRRLGPTGSARRRTMALVLTLAFSLLAPLSWHLIFKSHSGDHYHINYVLWHMPYVFLGAALCGRVLSDCGALLGGAWRPPPHGAADTKRNAVRADAPPANSE